MITKQHSKTKYLSCQLGSKLNGEAMVSKVLKKKAYQSEICCEDKADTF